VLDVDCGAGHALLAAAELVGPDGCAAGADTSATSFRPRRSARRHPWIGRQLVGLFRQAGLDGIQAHVLTYPSTDYDWAARVHGLTVAVDRAVASGALTRSQGQRWLEDRRRAAAAGRFSAPSRSSP
jgi:hypothetical protein